MREVLVLGDSHSGVLRNGFKARGWRTHGGILATGKQLEGDSVAVADGALRFTGARAQERYERALASVGAASILDVAIPIVSTFGFNTHRFMKAMVGLTIDPAETEGQYLSQDVFETIVAARRTSALAFYRHLRAKDVFAVHSPQRAQSGASKLSVAGDNLFAAWLRDMGVEVVDVRPQTVDANGRLREEFWRSEIGDKAHANQRYTDLVIDEIERRLAARATSSSTDRTARRSS